MQNAIKHLIDSLSNDNSEKSAQIYPAFKDKRYTPHLLTEKNIQKYTPKDNNLKVSAIDGGNIEIIKSPDTSIHLVRIYFNIFKNNKRITPETIPQTLEFYALCQSYESNSEIYYKTKLIPLKETHKPYLPEEKDLIFNSYDPTITTGIFRTPISKIGEISRKFAEWNISKHIIENELDRGDILLRDGSLQTGITNESLYSNAAYESAESKGAIFCGISKTSTLLATNGKSLVSAITKIAESKGEKDTWLYHPIAKSDQPDHRGEIYYVRLNKNSDYTFRFEIYDRQKEHAQAAIEQLAFTSKDISFPGYPYPLIDADKNARAKFQEINFHKTYIEHFMRTKSSINTIRSSVRAQDAHSLIDRIV